MRKQERQVLNKAIDTVKGMIDFEIEEGDCNTKFCMMYLEESINDLIGYASIQYRFEGMNTEELHEFIKTVIEFKNLMYDKINNSKDIKGDEEWMSITQIGWLRTGDIFTYKGRKYKTGNVINGTDGYVACTDIETRKVKRLHIDLDVEVGE